MSEIATDRMRKVKSILVTQEAPTDSNSPYLKLSEKFNVKIDFRPFIQVEPVPVKEFRKQKIDILNHTAIIFTSRNAVDHFFHICQELKVEMPPEMKYFCISEQTSNYLQKYIVIRKRKILTGLKEVFYDILAFFSPSGINSLYVNFPDFKQNNTRIAAFGPTTAKAVRDAGLILDIEAPLPNAPSMTGALELYIKKANGVK